MKNNLSILILILCLGNVIKAQNCVPNGYFDISDTCPNNIGQITYATGWHAAAYTPDYYNICANTIPYNSRGYQMDCCGGVGYAGIEVFGISPTIIREYMQIKLIDTLKSGHKYLASMYINRSNDIDYAIATMGMLFTDTVINLPYPQGFINSSPQVKNIVLLGDTLNWVLVQDSFTAIGTEDYLTIGNFTYDSLCDTVRVGGNGTYSGFTYNYVDGVSVYEIDGTCNNYWDAGYDKYIKAGDSIRMGAINTDNSTYSWQNSLGGNTYLRNNTDARPWSKPQENVTYYVTKTCPNNNVFTDTVRVYILPNINLGKDSVYCGHVNLPIILDAGAGQGYTYQWSTGATTQTIAVSNSGTYSVSVYSYPLMTGAKSTDEINLLFLDSISPNILHDTDLCNSSQFPIVLNATVVTIPGTYNSYTWVGGHVGSQLTVNNAGTYVVTVWVKLNDGSNTLVCKIKDTAYVSVGCMGIQQLEINNSRIYIFPNPNNGNMYIAYNLTENARLEITNVTGNIVGIYNMPAANTTLQIKSNDLSNGIYFYRVMCNDAMIKLGKIVIIQ